MNPGNHNDHGMPAGDASGHAPAHHHAPDHEPDHGADHGADHAAAGVVGEAPDHDQGGVAEPFPSASPLLALEDIHFHYPAHPPTLVGVDLTLHPGERIGLVGGNGCGKSTLLQLLVGLLRPSRGRVLAFDKPRTTEADFFEVRRRAGLVFQHADDQLFCPTVLEDVAFGPLNMGATPEEARDMALEALALVGLEGFAPRITYKLSGGEKRGVAIASVLAMHPDVLLLDEPTTGLDLESERRLRNLLERLPQAMILVSHDHGLVHDLSTRCLLLKEGRIHPLD